MAEQNSVPAVDTSLFATKAEMPSPATAAPPSVADSSATGTQTEVYALANHTHASKSRKARLTSGTDGVVTWTFDPPFSPGVSPRVYGQAVTPMGVTDVINVQTEGEPTNTSARLRVNRTNRSAVALLGLTILSVPSSPSATSVDLLALEP